MQCSADCSLAGEQFLLPCADVFVECGADCSLAGEQFLDHSFNLISETCLVEVESEDILAAVQSLEAAVVLIGLSDFEGRDYRLELCKQRVG